MKTPNVFMTNVNYITEFQIMAQYVIDTYHPKGISLVGVALVALAEQRASRRVMA